MAPRSHGLGYGFIFIKVRFVFEDLLQSRLKQGQKLLISMPILLLSKLKENAESLVVRCRHDQRIVLVQGTLP